MSPVPTNDRANDAFEFDTQNNFIGDDNDNHNDNSNNINNIINTTENNAHHINDEFIDDVDNDYQGYQPLPQEPESIEQQNDSEEEEEGLDLGSLLAATNLTASEPKAKVSEEEIEERKNLWKTPRNNVDTSMDQSEIDNIKSIMQSFQIPLNHIPEWAQQISEETWKCELLSKLCSNDDTK